MKKEYKVANSTVAIKAPAIAVLRSSPRLTYLFRLLSLLILLGLAGCGNQVIATIAVHADRTWTGSVQISVPNQPATPAGWQETLTAERQRQAAAILERPGVFYAWRQASVEGQGDRYSISLWGQDLSALVEAVFPVDAVTERLGGPVVLDLQGPVQAGRPVELTLPANPSTGYSWAIADKTNLVQVGEIETQPLSEAIGGPARQIVRLQAGETGPATLRLVYRRPWETTAPPSRAVAIDARDLGLSEACAALSKPLVTLSLPSGSLAAESPSPARPAPSTIRQTLPPAFNWCAGNDCPPIKDQRACGSCWAHAIVGTLELSTFIKQGLVQDLSEQFLISCNESGYGCDGGPFSAHDYHARTVPGEAAAGAELESDFPYVAAMTPCYGPFPHPQRILSWAYVRTPPNVPTVDEIKQAIYEYGPVATTVCVGNAFMTYSGGVFETDECSWPNHAVVLVGWDDNQGTNGVWFLRNSWGPWWGEDGYMRIGYGTSAVGEGTNYIVHPAAWYTAYLPDVYRSYPSEVPTWKVTTMYGFGRQWGFISLDVDAALQPHIAYSDAIDGCIEHLHLSGTVWLSETVDCDGFVPSLKLDRTGHPHVAYYDGWPDYDLIYAHLSSTVWITEVVNGAGDVYGDGISLALDADDLPHISYCAKAPGDYNCGDLKYARYDGTSWQTQTVDTGASMRFPSLALGTDGQPQVSYCAYYSGPLECRIRYARYNGTSWQTQTIGLANTMHDSSLALDPANQPHIAYGDSWARIYYVYYDGTSWISQTASTRGRNPALSLDTAGRPHIAYITRHPSGRYDMLVHTYLEGATWIDEVVDRKWYINSVGWSNICLDMDPGDWPHIIYLAGPRLMYGSRSASFSSGAAAPGK